MVTREEGVNLLITFREENLMKKGITFAVIALVAIAIFSINYSVVGAEQPKKVRVAFGHMGPVSDEGWTWSHDHGRKAVESAFPDRVETVTVENIPYSAEATRVFQQFVNDGADLIIVSGEFADLLYKVSDKNPDVKFLECNSNRTADNLSNYYGDYYNPAYLIGMAAGLLTKTDKLGYIGSFVIPNIYADVNAYTMGAQSVNPKATTNVVIINSWFDPSKAKQAAETLIDSGCDFLYGPMDEPAYLQVAEKRGVWAATYNTDNRRFGPEAYVSSMLWQWDDIYVSEVQKLLDGTWTGNRHEFMPISKGVDRDIWGKNVPVEAQRKVDKVRDKMIRDGYTPFVGPIKDAKGKIRVPAGEKLSKQFLFREWNWPVEGVTGLPYN